MKQEKLKELHSAGFPLEVWTEHNYEEDKNDDLVCSQCDNIIKMHTGITSTPTLVSDYHLNCPEGKWRYSQVGLEEVIDELGEDFTGLYQEINDKKRGIYFTATACRNKRGEVVEAEGETAKLSAINLYIAINKK